MKRVSARGQEKSVILTARQDHVDSQKIAFDLNHYPIISWAPEDSTEILKGTSKSNRKLCMDKDQEQPRFRMKGTIRRIDKKQMDFLTNLENQRKNYVLQLEEMFGPRDPNFEFGSIERSTDEDGMPQTYFPLGYRREGGCLVNIQISPWPYDNQCLGQATWHNCP